MPLSVGKASRNYEERINEKLLFFATRKSPSRSSHEKRGKIPLAFDDELSFIFHLLKWSQHHSTSRVNSTLKRIKLLLYN